MGTPHTRSQCSFCTSCVQTLIFVWAAAVCSRPCEDGMPNGPGHGHSGLAHECWLQGRLASN
eukprot:12406236-Karenia_brevis.AAC.1